MAPSAATARSQGLHRAHDAARGDPDRGDACGEGRPPQPMRCVRFVALATVREVVELVLEQVDIDEIARNGLSRGVVRGYAANDLIEIFASQLFGAGSALQPVALEIARIQLIQERRRVAANQIPRKPRTATVAETAWLRLAYSLGSGLSTPSARMICANGCGPQHSPVETARDREKPVLTVNRPLVLTLVRFHDPAGVVASENTAQDRRATREPSDLVRRKREARSSYGAGFCIPSHVVPSPT